MQTVSRDISLDAIGPKTKHWLYVSVVQNIELCTGIRAREQQFAITEMNELFAMRSQDSS